MSDDDQSMDEDVSEDDIFERMPTKQERIGKLSGPCRRVRTPWGWPAESADHVLVRERSSMRQHPLKCLSPAFCRQSQF